MIPASDRTLAVKLIDEAWASGARKFMACRELEISLRTYQRWTKDGGINVDLRPTAQRPTPPNKLTTEERAEVLKVANNPDFKNLPPSQIVPILADQGRYLASESSFYRILRESGQQRHRGRSQAPQKRTVTTYKATGPNQVWCWDITWLPGSAKGFHYYLYLILDIFSRKIVGWEIYDEESSENAAQLVRKAHLREQVGNAPLVLHSDNGSPMKGASLMETLYKLDVISSYSRPRVSNDNAYAESIFKTCKYRPDYPYKGFTDINAAREWVLGFVRWYNQRHRHSGLKFLTPNQRHSGEASQVVLKRQQVSKKAKKKNPERWSGKTRDWEPAETVYLNPVTDSKGKKKAS